MEKCEVILDVAAEGGGLSIYGIRSGSGWLFSGKVIDQTPALLDEQSIQYQSPFVDTWEGALKRLDRYAWCEFYPLQVHPEFQDRVLAAVVSRCAAKGSVRARLDDWRRSCGVDQD